MAERAHGLLVLWNDVDPAVEVEYEDWHANEHVPERLTVPGILWGRRYGRVGAGAMPRYLTLYGLRDAAVLESEAYRRLLREPTPASRRMRPALRNVCRWVCDLLEDRSGEAASGAVRALPLQAFEWLSQSAGHRTVGRRDAGAADLPWLAGAQSRLVEGDWFVCEAQSGERSFAVTATSTSFRRLPISGR
jgi:hypothetical protein